MDGNKNEWEFMSILKLEQVSKYYQRQRILEHIDLEIQAGQFFGLVGVNGAGKTTLIKSILDFCDIDQGNINIFGKAHTQANARSRLAFLPEQFTLPPYLTGQLFLNHIVRLHEQNYDAQHIKMLCKTLDFPESVLSQSVRNYSKGMIQKLGLISCFLSRKELLILDEPMSGLDPKARAFLKRYLLELKAQKTTVFFTTHLLVDVETLCDQMAILHEGHLRFIGSPSQCCLLYREPNLEMAYLRCIEAI